MELNDAITPAETVEMTEAAEKSAKPTKPAKNRIRDWKGLIHDAPFKVKAQAFLALFVVGSTMTFTQLGFIGVGANGKYLCYVMGLLVPVVAAALLMGKGAGALEGFASGMVLCLHSRVQPLNLVERYFVGIFNSIVLFTFAGFALGLLFAIALRNNPTGKRRVVYLALVSFFGSVYVSVAFLIHVLFEIVLGTLQSALEHGAVGDVPFEWINALDGLGSLETQWLLNLALLFAVSLFVDFIVRFFAKAQVEVSVRTVFGSQLFVVVFLVLCVLSALSYVAITIQNASDTYWEMGDDMTFIAEQLSKSEKNLNEIMQNEEMQNVSEDTLESIINMSYLRSFISGYNPEKNGTVVVFVDDSVLLSNSPAYPVGKTTTELFGEGSEDYASSLAESGELREGVYDTKPFDASSYGSNYTTAELGYVRALNHDGYTIMMAMPFSKVFAGRQATMTWTTLLSSVLLTVVYLLAARLLNKDVVTPIDRTNDSLAQITDGELDTRVTECDSVEFASLSTGINNTVDALKGYIDEAETRMERELNTAKAIQKSALPRVFPPFPEVDKFDIFASMNAAKEVGGDFYDYFLIDDHTLGFLIADVSGKGIPGALFMMAAKTELENYMSTGMELSQAIATANSRLCANNDAGMFVTVWAATLDYNTGELTYVNAGHNFPLLRHGFNGEWEWLKKRCGLFLGTFETAKYRQEKLMLAPGDELLLYTDGVNEAFNVDEEEYGNDRLEKFLAAHANMHSREVVRSLRADVARWAEGAEQSDDVTILALEYGVVPEVTGTATMQAKLENLEVATSLVNKELEARLCPVDVQHKVEVALEELFVNVCRYAYADKDEPGTIHVRYAYGANPSTITVELRDQGVPFDPIKCEDPTKPSSAQEATIGGLGIFMVRKTMDDFTYMRNGDTNVVVFKKGW